MIAEMKTYVPGKKDVCGPKLDKEYVIKLDSGMLDENGVVCVHGIFTGEKLVRCKDCKYYELNSWANVNGIPLIVAHQICKRWGEGCKTDENGFCFMGEKVTE